MNLIYLIGVIVVNLSSFHIPRVEIQFKGIEVLELDPKSDTIVQSWSTDNFCTYRSIPETNEIEYKEWKGNKLVKKFKHPVVSYKDDAEVREFTANAPNGEYKMLIWKNAQMVAIQTSTATYLVTCLNCL